MWEALRSAKTISSSSGLLTRTTEGCAQQSICMHPSVMCTVAAALTCPDLPCCAAGQSQGHRHQEHVWCSQVAPAAGAAGPLHCMQALHTAVLPLTRKTPRGVGPQQLQDRGCQLKRRTGRKAQGCDAPHTAKDIPCSCCSPAGRQRQSSQGKHCPHTQYW